MNLKSLSTLLVVAFAATACSTFTKEQCQKMDWSFEGYQRAREGQHPEPGIAYFAEHCEKEHGVPVNQTLFSDGYKKGLDIFCTREMGYQFARKGGHYNGVCPREKEDAFLSRFTDGRLGYLEERVTNLEQDNGNLKNENQRLRSRVSELETKVSNQNSEIQRAVGEASTCKAQVIR